MPDEAPPICGTAEEVEEAGTADMAEAKEKAKEKAKAKAKAKARAMVRAVEAKVRT